MIRLCINADDLGYNKERDDGIIASFVNGCVTSASVFAGDDWSSKNTLAYLRHLQESANKREDGEKEEEVGKSNSRYDKKKEPATLLHSLGLHFNLTEGRPIVSPGLRRRKLVHGSDGGSGKSEERGGRANSDPSQQLDVFPGKFAWWKIAGYAPMDEEDGKVLRVDEKKAEVQTHHGETVNEEADEQVWELCPDLIRQELYAQIAWFRAQTDTLPVHIDGHNHIHIHPLVAQVLADVMCELRIQWVRLPRDIMATDEIHHAQQRNLAASIVRYAAVSRKFFDAKDLLYTDYFVGLSQWGKDEKELTAHLKDALVQTERHCKARGADDAATVVTLEYMVSSSLLLVCFASCA